MNVFNTHNRKHNKRVQQRLVIKWTWNETDASAGASTHKFSLAKSESRLAVPNHPHTNQEVLVSEPVIQLKRRGD